MIARQRKVYAERRLIAAAIAEDKAEEAWDTPDRGWPEQARYDAARRERRAAAREWLEAMK